MTRRTALVYLTDDGVPMVDLRRHAEEEAIVIESATYGSFTAWESQRVMMAWLFEGKRPADVAKGRQR